MSEELRNENEQIDDIAEISAMLDEMERQDRLEEERTQQRKKKLRRGRVIYYGLLSFFLVIFVGCAAYIADYMLDSRQTANNYSDLAEQIQNLRDQNTQNNKDPEGNQNPDNNPSNDPTGETTGKEEEDENLILPELRDLYSKYNYLVGWIKVPNTDVDYPVFQTPDKPNFYLRKDMDGNYSRWGCIYVREQCDVFKPSDNVVIYGHHMKDGSMFYSLDNYYEYDFWKENQYFSFDTLYEHHTYQVIAVFKTSANIGKGFAYHVFNDAQNEAEFNAFMDKVHELQLYDTGISAQYGDMLLTLSTCEYTLDNGRFVVISKRVS
jgi:sortase B